VAEAFSRRFRAFVSGTGFHQMTIYLHCSRKLCSTQVSNGPRGRYSREAIARRPPLDALWNARCRSRSLAARISLRMSGRICSGRDAWPKTDATSRSPFILIGAANRVDRHWLFNQPSPSSATVMNWYKRVSAYTDRESRRCARSSIKKSYGREIAMLICMNKSTVVTLTLFLAAPILAQSSKRHDSSGEALFQEQCIGCHGPDGRGQTELGKKLGAADLTSDAIWQQPDAELAKIVKDGKGQMPTFDKRLSDDEICGVITYIRQLAKKQ
jgi:mono/diheme cytochrome c family protein